MPATEISIAKAKTDKLFYFVANVVVYRESDGRCLLLKRSEREVAHPGKYGVPGGKLEWADLDIAKPTRIQNDVLDYQDALERLLAREAREEAGIEIASDDLRYINSVAYIRPDGVPTMMIKCTARYQSGEVRLEAGSFTDYIWVNAEEARQLETIEGIPDEIEKAIGLYKK